METKQVQASGAIVYWTCGPTDASKLHARFTGLGLGNCSKKERPKPSALEQALKEYAEERMNSQMRRDGHDKILQRRKQPSKNGFELVDVERGDERNSYSTDFGCKVDNFGNLTFSDGFPDEDRVSQLFQYHQQYLTGAMVGSCLVKVMRTLLGVCMRQNGGLYWLPESSLGMWDLVANAVEECSDNSANKVTRIRTVFDSQAASAVKDAIVEEVVSESQRIADEVAKGEGGQKALERKIKLLTDLENKATHYERILGEALTNVKSVVQQVQHDATIALMQAAPA